MSRPLIAVTCGTGFTPAWPGKPQDRLFRLYAAAIANAGGVPLVLPCLDHNWLPGALPACVQGLLLTGGSDVGPAHYGAEPHPSTVADDPARDRVELDAIRAFVEADVPVLGICRGIQTLNVALGGTLVQDIATCVPGALPHRQAAARATPTHTIEIASGSRLARMTGAYELAVNSFHHQAVERVADGLVVTARASDGVIEAAEMPGKRFVVTVQYHPEEMEPAAEHARALFAAFVEAAAGRE